MGPKQPDEKQDDVEVQVSHDAVGGPDRFVHMVYEAVLDNSLWPEMISELLDYVEDVRAHPEQGTDEVRGMARHLERAFELSEATISLQERNSMLTSILDGMAIGVAVYDRGGAKIFDNTADSPDRLRLPLPDQPALPTAASQNQLIVPTTALADVQMPPDAAWLVLTLPQITHETFAEIGRSYFLTSAETRLMGALFTTGNLRAAAQQISVTYETARTYLKRILSKTGCRDQAGLQMLISRNPTTLIRTARRDEAAKDTRQSLRLSSGYDLEYFTAGPEDGALVLHFDALTGVAIDLLGSRKIYEPTLQELNLRIVTPCRPGTFRSDFRSMQSLTGFTPDLNELLDHLGASQATLFSTGFGSSSALAYAATAPERVKHAVLCAPSYPNYEPADWRNMDVFYIISGVIGKRAPALMRKIIPFLMRSVMQNTEKYLARHVKRSRCPADIGVLTSPRLHKRIPEVLAQRTASGVAGLVQENFLNTHGWDFDLSAVTSPVTIIQGALDNTSDPEGARRLGSMMPNVDFRLHDDLGQYLIFTEWPWLLEICANGFAEQDNRQA